jgi:DNA-binding MarR family transcriptional regulator
MARNRTQPNEETGRELELGLIDEFVGPRVRVLWNLLAAGMAKALAPFDLRAGGFSALALIAANPGCSQNQLARALGMDKSAVVALVKELERRGLAERVPGRDDRRFRALRLTAKGKTVLVQMMKPGSQPGAPIRAALSPREMEQLLSLLDRACRAMQASSTAKDAQSSLSRSETKAHKVARTRPQSLRARQQVAD